MDEFNYLRKYSKARLGDRDMDELIGLSRGMMADGQIVQAEAEFLNNWLEKARGHLNDPFYNLLAVRLRAMLQDGVLDAEEASELQGMLQALTGDDGNLRAYQKPTSLPLDNPMPDIALLGKGLVFTGVMAYGPRAECEKLVTDRGGISKSSPSKKVNYLVIGTIANEHWIHSSHGRKIQKAVELRSVGHPIAIVSEDHFMSSILSN
jgi:NAD-dependent DNA ligase